MWLPHRHQAAEGRTNKASFHIPHRKPSMHRWIRAPKELLLGRPGICCVDSYHNYKGKRSRLKHSRTPNIKQVNSGVVRGSSLAVHVLLTLEVPNQIYLKFNLTTYGNIWKRESSVQDYPRHVLKNFHCQNKNQLQIYFFSKWGENQVKTSDSVLACEKFWVISQKFDSKMPSKDMWKLLWIRDELS